MTDDLLRLLSLSWSDAASAIALVLSGSALFLAQRLSQQTERKVDGMLGELPPNIALYPSEAPSRDGVEILVLQVDNYNRRPIRLTGVRVEHPTKLGLVAYHLLAGREVLLGDMNRRHNEVATSIVVEGTPPGASDFNGTRLKLLITGQLPAPKRKKPARVSVQVDYELLKSTPEPFSETVHLNLRRVPRKQHAGATSLPAFPQPEAAAH